VKDKILVIGLGIIFVALFGSCAPNYLEISIEGVPGPGKDSEFDIRELVVRNLVNKVYPDSVIFISFNHGSDPPEEFLDRFSDMKTIMRPYSESIDAVPVLGINTRIIDIRMGDWVKPSKAKVGFKSSQFQLGGGRYVWTNVVLEDGKWFIEMPAF
jgi:hypothetical protein